MTGWMNWRNLPALPADAVGVTIGGYYYTREAYNQLRRKSMSEPDVNVTAALVRELDARVKMWEAIANGIERLIMLAMENVTKHR